MLRQLNFFLYFFIIIIFLWETVAFYGPLRNILLFRYYRAACLERGKSRCVGRADLWTLRKFAYYIPNQAADDKILSKALTHLCCSFMEEIKIIIQPGFIFLSFTSVFSCPPDSFITTILFEPPHDKTNKMTRPPSLIRVFAVRLMGS